MANKEKVYTIRIEATQAQQALETAIKQFADYKVKAAAANQEVKESKAIYQENTAALKELVQQQKALETAKKTASAGAPAMGASAALDKNLAAQKLLNSIVQESKIDFQNAKAAAEAAGAAVGKQAVSVKELQAAMKGYGAAAAAAALEFAPGTIGAIELEVDQLRANLKNLAPESQEAAAAIQLIASKESELRKLGNATRALNPEVQTRAFTAFNQALVGSVGIATTAAQVFGLSEQNAQKYAQQMQALTGVLYSVESVSKFLNGENLSLVKTLYTGAKAWLGFGTAAEAGSKAARVGFASTGIGLLVLAVGALISLFMDLGSTVKGSESTFTQYKAAVVGVFNGLIEAVKDYFKFLYQVATFDFSGAIKTAQGAGKDIATAYTKGRAGVIEEAQRKELAHEAEKTARYISIIQSRGEDTLALEVANSKRLIDAQKEGSKEQLDAVRDYIALKNQYLKRQADEEKAQALARLEGLAAIDAAAGKAVIERQRAVLAERLQQQLAADELAGRGQSAATIKLLTEIQAVEEAYEKEVREKRQAAELVALDARISLRAAKGQEAFAQEVARANKELQFLKLAAQRDEAAIIAAQANLNDLRAARAYELTQRLHALRLAELDGVISLENTKGEESYQDQVKREEKALAYMKQLGTRNLAAEVAQQSKIDNLKAAHALKVEADERAADLARLNARIAFLQAKGEDTTQLQLNFKAKELATLLAAATKNEAAIIAKQGEIDALIAQQQELAAEKRRAQLVEDFENDMTILDKQGKDTLALRVKFARAQVALDTDTSEKGLARRRADVQKLRELEAELGQRGPDLGGSILQKFFGVKEEDVQQVKGKLNEAFASIAQSVGGTVDAMLSSGLSEAQAQIDAAQTRLSELGAQLSAASSARQSTEDALQTASGARRDYLLKKLEQERAAEQKLASEKAKAAKEEQAAQREKAKLDKQQQQISAASTAIEALLLGIKAAQTLVDIASKGKFGIDNIALAIAAAAALGGGIYAMKNAAGKFESGTGALGSDGVLRGPRHGQGGIGLFNSYGHFFGEAEGGEAITPVDASRHNAGALALIRTKGRTRQLTLADFAEASNVQVLPPPSGYYANGGVLGGRGAQGADAAGSLPAGSIAIQQADLTALLDTNRAMLSHLQQVASATSTTANYGPARLLIGPGEALSIEAQRQEALRAQAEATL